MFAFARCLICGALAGGLVATAASARADTLVLKDGRRITGDVIEIGGRYMVKSSAGSATFAVDEVAKWEKAAVGAAPGAGAGVTSPRQRPQKAASPAEISARAAKLIEQGNAALSAGDAQAALENFQDARSLWDRQHVRIDVNDEGMFNVLHGIGIAYLALGRYDKASEPLARAYPSSLRGRSLTINAAILDVVQRVNVMHGIKELKDYLSSQSAPDEVALNVMGASMGLAATDERLWQGQFFQQMGRFYEKKNAELEATRPGQRRWGTEWLPVKQARTHLVALEAGVAKYNAAIEAVRTAEGNVKAAQSIRDGATSPAAVNAANADLALANDMRAAAIARQKEAWRNIPRPEWPKTFPPVLPESLGGGVFGVPAAPAAPVAVAALPAAVAPAKPPKVEPADTILIPVAPKDPPPETPKETVTTPPPAVPPVVTKAGKPMVSRYAVAVPVAPDLLLTAAAPLEGAGSFHLETAAGNSFEAQLVRRDSAIGLALLRVSGQRLPYLNLAVGTFTGGELVCWGFPDVNIFNPVADSIAAKAVAPKGEKWTVALIRHPRLPGAAVLDKGGNLVGLALGDRDTVASLIPAVTADQIRTFLGADVPKAACANPDPSLVMQLTASHEAQ
jgi:tetratricopeptide (TPR) repeat protein